MNQYRIITKNHGSQNWYDYTLSSAKSNFMIYFPTAEIIDIETL